MRPLIRPVPAGSGGGPPNAGTAAPNVCMDGGCAANRGRGRTCCAVNPGARHKKKTMAPGSGRVRTVGISTSHAFNESHVVRRLVRPNGRHGHVRLSGTDGYSAAMNGYR